MRAHVLFLCLLAAGTAFASEAGKLYADAQREERAGHMARAYLLYSQAAALEPANQFYWLKSQALRTRAALEAKVMPTPLAGEALPGLDDTAPAVQIPKPTPQDLAEARQPLPPHELVAKPAPQDFDLQGDSKALFEKVARAFGLEAVFDPDYQPVKSFRFRMQQADYREALHALEASTASFIVPLSGRMFLVARDTVAKRAEFEPQVAVAVNLTEPTSVQDLTGLITAVQQSMGIRKVSWDTANNIVVLRDAISKVLPAQQLLIDLLYPRAQVVIEMKFLEVASNAIQSFGLTIPNDFPIVALTRALQNSPTIPTGIARLALIGGGKTLLGIGIADATLIANLSRSNGRMLLHSETRSVDGQPATLHVGDRFPVLTSGYYGPADYGGDNAYRPPPSFTFEDLGLKVKATPKVHGMDAVTLELESEFRVLTGQYVNEVPVIANRQLKNIVRLEMDEWAVVAGLMKASEARTVAGMAGVSTLPVIGPLFSKHTTTRESTEVLVLLRARLVTPPPTEVVTHVFRVGSEARPLTPL